MLLPVVSVLLASALFGGLVRPRHSVETALLCCALVMLSSFSLPVLVDVDGVSRFDWERTALSVGAAIVLWSAARLRARPSAAVEAQAAQRRNTLVGLAAFALFFLLATSASYSSVVYRVAMLELPDYSELRGADSPANAWLRLPFTADDRRASPFALALAVSVVGGVLALVVWRAPNHVLGVALRIAAALVKGLVLTGLCVLAVAANWPTFMNPISVTRHVYDWAVVVGSLSVMLALRDRASSTFWVAAALGAMGAVRAAEQARYQIWYTFPDVWHEFTEGVLLRALPLGLAVGFAASRLVSPTGKRRGLGWLGGGCLTIACALLSLDGLTWFAPGHPSKDASQTTHCIEEAPGDAYHVVAGATSLAPGPARQAFSSSRTPANALFTSVVLHASLDEPATEYLPVLAVGADYGLHVYVYASYLESVDLWTVPQFYVSNSSCAIAGASLGRLRNEQPPSSVRSLQQLLAWLGKAP